MLRKVVLAGVLVLLVSLQAAAATRFVSKSGSDSNTGLSWAAAWSTITKVNSSSAGGDTIVFGTGVWRAVALVPKAGTTSDRTCYIDSGFFYATPTTYPTRRVAWIYGSDSLGNWTQVGTSNVWQTTYTARSSNGYVSLWQGGNNNVLLGQTSQANVNSAGKFYSSGTQVFAWLASNANPNNFDMEASVRECVNIISSSSGAPDNWSVVGIGFKYGDNRIVTGDENARNNFNNVYFDHCYMAYAAGWGGVNPSLFYNDVPSSYDSVCTGGRIRACSLGTCWSFTGSNNNISAIMPQVEDQSHGNCITLYSAKGWMIDSNVVFGYQSEAAIYLKYGILQGSTDGALIYDTIAFNRIVTRSGLPYGIRLFGAVHNTAIYGNIISGPATGVQIGYSGVTGWGNEGYHTIQNNTFYNCGSSVGQWNVEAVATPYYHRHSVFRYNVTYRATGTNTMDLDNATYWDKIDSNLYYAASGSNSWMGSTWANWQTRGFDKNNSKNTTNPGFKNAAAGDFSRDSTIIEMNQTYGGRVWTKYGAIQGGSSLVDSIPPATTNDLHGSVTTSPAQILLSWTAPGDDGSVGIAAGYDIGFSTSPITTSTWSTGSVTHVGYVVSPLAAGASQTLTLTSSNGLTGGRLYYLGLKAYDEFGNYSGLSNITSATTLADTTPPNQVTSLAAAAGSSAAQLVLTWKAPGSNGSTGTAAGYDIGFSIDSITNTTWSTSSVTHVGNLVTPVASGGNQTLTLSSTNGLAANTKYWVALKAYDSTGNYSVLSNVPSATTPAQSDNVAPSRVTNLACAQGANPAQLVLTWTAPGNNGTVGTATGYQIGFSIDSITSANWSTTAVTKYTNLISPTAYGTSQTFTLTSTQGLAAGTKYWVALKAYDSAGNYATLSNVPSATTKPVVVVDTIAPSRVRSLTCVAGSSAAQLVLTWNAPGNNGTSGKAYGYQIGYSTDTITSTTWSTAAVTKMTNLLTPSTYGTSQTVTLTAAHGLVGGTKYYVGLKAFDSAGNYANLSNIPSATTKAAVISDTTPPATVANLVCVAPSTPGELTLSWTAPGDDGTTGQVAGYEVGYSLDSITTSTWNTINVVQVGHLVTPVAAGSQQALTLTKNDGLLEGARYWVGVIAYDSSGNYSGLSNIPSAITNSTISSGGEVCIAQPVSPINGETVADQVPTFTVTNTACTAPGPHTYYFQIATDSLFVHLVESSPQLTEGNQQTSWTSSSRLTAGTYYWHVQVDSFDFCDAAGFVVAPQSIAYPNPFSLSGAGQITFTDLPQGSNLLIISVSGEVIKRWTEIQSGTVSWNGSNQSGNWVSPGTYLWYIENSSTNGKIIIKP